MIIVAAAVALHVGQVTHQAVEGHQRGADRAALALLIVEARALGQQQAPVIVQPALEHGPFRPGERWLHRFRAHEAAR